MNSKIARTLMMTFSLSTSSAIMAQPKLIPVVNGQFTTGQWYFDGNKSGLGGNAGLTVVPALRYSNRFSLLPTFNSFYRGTRSAEELAGGNTLFQDTWENGASIKAVHGLSKNWKLKEQAGFRMKWFRETVDESWNHGLYDYRTLNVGAELEHQWNKSISMALAYDYSFLQFPNYESLEASQSNAPAREFAGKNVLDEKIHLFSLRGRAPLFWKIGTDIQTFYSPRTYTDQTIVQVTGLLSAETRKDDYVGATLGLNRTFRTTQTSRILSNVYYGYSGFNSNQNHYDARLTTFIADFYDYKQQRLGTEVDFVFGSNPNSPLTIETGYSYSKRDYQSRVIQSSAGNYLSEKLYVTETYLTLGFSYPLAKNVRLRATSAFGRSKSNNQYESTYRYNYSNSNYQFGFTYDY